MKIFPGFDLRSPTLKASPVAGDCMRGIIGDEYCTVYTDTFPPIFSGDFVRLWLRYPDGEVMAIVKRLRVTRNGRWYGECADGVFEIGNLVLPSAIEKVVALSTESMEVSGCPSRGEPSRRRASDEDVQTYARLALAAVFEWQNLGHLDGVPFPGLDVLNYCIPGTAEKSPTWRPPVPL